MGALRPTWKKTCEDEHATIRGPEVAALLPERRLGQAGTDDFNRPCDEHGQGADELYQYPGDFRRLGLRRQYQHWSHAGHFCSEHRRFFPESSSVVSMA